MPFGQLLEQSPSLCTCYEQAPLIDDRTPCPGRTLTTPPTRGRLDPNRGRCATLADRPGVPRAPSPLPRHWKSASRGPRQLMSPTTTLVQQSSFSSRNSFIDRISPLLPLVHSGQVHGNRGPKSTRRFEPERHQDFWVSYHLLSLASKCIRSCRAGRSLANSRSIASCHVSVHWRCTCVVFSVKQNRSAQQHSLPIARIDKIQAKMAASNDK